MAVQSSTNTNAMTSSSSRPLRLHRRPDLSAHRQSYQGRDYWVIKDPISLKYYRFEEEENALLEMMHEYGSFIEQMQSAISILDQLASNAVNDTDKTQSASTNLSSMSQQLKLIVDDFQLH